MNHKIFSHLNDKGKKRVCPFRKNGVKIGSFGCSKDCKAFMGSGGKGFTTWVRCREFQEHPEKLLCSFHEPLPMDHKVIEEAVLLGEEVYASNLNYKVIRDSVGQYLIHSQFNDHYIGLSGRAGTDAEGKLNMSNFFKVVHVNDDSLDKYSSGYSTVVLIPDTIEYADYVCLDIRNLGFYNLSLLKLHIQNVLTPREMESIKILDIEAYADEINRGENNEGTLVGITTVYTN